MTYKRVTFIHRLDAVNEINESIGVVFTTRASSAQGKKRQSPPHWRPLTEVSTKTSVTVYNPSLLAGAFRKICASRT